MCDNNDMRQIILTEKKLQTNIYKKKLLCSHMYFICNLKNMISFEINLTDFESKISYI